MRSQNGFTLVEGIVAGILVAVVGVALVTIFGVYIRATNEGVARTRLQMQYEAFIQRIAADVRRSNSVHASSGGVIDVSRPASSAEIILDSAGISFIGYKVESNVLKRAHQTTGVTIASAMFIAESAGGQSILLTKIDPAFQVFKLVNGTNDAVEINAKETLTYKGVGYADLPKGGWFQCRN